MLQVASALGFSGTVHKRAYECTGHVTEIHCRAGCPELCAGLCPDRQHVNSPHVASVVAGALRMQKLVTAAMLALAGIRPAL